MREMLSIPDRGQIRIFIGGEALAPDFNLFDYALSYDSTIKSFRHFRPHTLISFSRDLRFGGVNRGSEDDSPGFADRTRFCDFIYANRNGHAMRAKIFSELSVRFGGVESLGKFMNNNKSFLTQSRETEKHRNWRAEKIKLQERFLFSIAAENARFPGYTSEKLLTSLAAGSVPIYWGNPFVAEEFNERRFINFTGDDFEELSQQIETLYASPQMWAEVVRQRALTEEQEVQLEYNRADLIHWFSGFFDKEVGDLQVRPKGWYPDWYAGMSRVGLKVQILSPSRARGAWRKLTKSQHSV